MDANAVRALVAQKFPGAMASPLAQVFSTVVAKDATDAAIGFAQLQAMASKAAMKREAVEHAISCIDACRAQDIDYDEETLSHSIECSFPDLSREECDDAAESAIDSFGV